MKLQVYYSSSYACKNTPLLARLAETANELSTLPFVEFKEPKSFDPLLLQGLHSDEYLNAFISGIEPLASSQGIKWTPSVREATFAMLSGQIDAAEYAFKHGIAMNLARGFHHAVYEMGSGYCPINGLALIAHIFKDKRVVVLDCDEHGGNGTEELSERIPNLYNISIFGTRFGCRGGKRSWAIQVAAQNQDFDWYESALQAAYNLIEQLNPDIILYQAGADCHENDPKSRVKLTTEEMFSRDSYVFKIAKSRSIPILFSVAGGYQDPKEVAKLNANTVLAAKEYYFE